MRWYGGGTRRVALAGGVGHWYKSGRGLVPLRWVFVRDRDGTHRDEYFFTTDPALSPEAIVGHYAWRWNIETTFQECRWALGLETTRGWCRTTVLRAAPCLFGLYTVVALLFAALPESAALGRRGVAGQGGGRPSPTRWRRCGGGCGRSGFSHRPGAARPSKNSPSRCETAALGPRPGRMKSRKLHQSS